MITHRLVAAAIVLGCALGCTSLDSPPPAAAQCAGATSQYCPALDDAPAGCFSLNTECGTLVNCNGQEYSCSSPGLVADCVATDCVDASMCALSGSADQTPCSRCLARKCCSAWGACEADTACVACIQSQSTTCSDANFDALLSCGTTYCGSLCAASQ